LSLLALLLAGLLAAPPAGAKTDRPSQRPMKGCKWERLSDTTLGLEAWVQRCDLGSRKIDFLVDKRSLAIRYSDGGAPEPVVDVLDLRENESPEAGMKRVFAEHTDPAVARRCVLAPWKGSRARRGATRLTFAPDAAYAKELAKTADPMDIPEPACGDWGEAPDGIQYFEVQPGARRVLFVRVGQDVPLFDEQTLRILPR